MNIPEFIEEQPYEKGFLEYYKSKIIPLLEVQNQEREKLLGVCRTRKSKAIKIAVVLIFLSIAIDFFILYPRFQYNDHVLRLFQICSMYIILLGSWTYFPLRTSKNEIKSKLLPLICEFFGNIKYELKPGPEVEDVSKLAIFPDFSTVKYEDYIHGTYKNVSFNLREMTLIQKGKKRDYTTFHGIVLVIHFPKAFEGTTIVRKDQGGILNIIDKFTIGSQFEKIYLEDPKFESIFEVYGTNQVESRFLLSTGFMEKLLNFSALHSQIKQTSRPVQCEFIDSKLVIALPSSRNLFEPIGFFFEAWKTQDIHIFLRQMNEIFTLIDVLKLA